MQQSKRARIVVIDDHPDHLACLSELLRRAGYEVLSFVSAVAAVPYLQRGWMHLVVTEVVMPDMDGFELLEAVQVECPTVPLVALGRVDTSFYLECIRHLGACAAFTRPLDTAEFLRVVAALVAGRPASPA